MTKDEIKKALECCISYKDGMCKHCPNYDYKHEDCMDDVKRQALDLIVKQEKEIDLQDRAIALLRIENKELKTNCCRILEKNTQSLYIIVSPEGGIASNIFTGKGTVYADKEKAEEALHRKNEWSKIKGYGVYELVELEVEE